MTKSQQMLAALSHPIIIIIIFVIQQQQQLHASRLRMYHLPMMPIKSIVTLLDAPGIYSLVTNVPDDTK